MNRKDKSRVTIEIYDADGELRESLGGEYTYRQTRDMMKDIIINDGIPVIRRLGKHEAAAHIDHKGEMKLLELPKADPIPMVLEYKFDGVEFRAAGHPLDVHCANEALLKRIFEEKS